MGLKEDIEDDFKTVFSNPDEFGDEVAHNGLTKRVLLSKLENSGYETQQNESLLYLFGNIDDFRDIDVNQEIILNDTSYFIHSWSFFDNLINIVIGRD